MRPEVLCNHAYTSFSGRKHLSELASSQGTGANKLTQLFNWLRSLFARQLPLTVAAKEPKPGTFRITREEMQDGRIFYYNEEYYTDRHKYIDRVSSLQSQDGKVTRGWVFNIPPGEKIDGEYTNCIKSWFRYPYRHCSLEEATDRQLKLTGNMVKEATHYYVN
jgi:hypothetical protein